MAEQATERAEIGPARGEHIPASAFALLGLMTVFWGINFPIMKLALLEFEPWAFRVICLGVGAGGLFALVKIGGRRIAAPRRDWRMLVICSLLNITAWHLLSAFGISLLPAGRAAILAYTMPLWAAMLAWIYLGERLTPLRLAGLALGVGAMLLLIGDEISRLGAAPWGALFMIGAAVTWAAGTVALKRHRWSMGTAVLTAWQMAIGGIPVVVGYMFLGQFPAAGAISLTGWLAIVYAASIPMVLCHWAWFRLVGLVPAGVAAIGTLLIPVVGVISSSPLTGEEIGPREIASLVLVVAALTLVLALPAWLQRPKAAIRARS